METTNNQKYLNSNKYSTNKNMTTRNRSHSNSNNTIPIPIKATPIKVYFPDISLQTLNDILCPSKKKGDKQEKHNTPSKIINCDISKYLVEEKSKVIIYSSTGIFEVVDNSLLQLYPIDVNIKEMIVNNKLRLLLDSSYMKRYQSPSYQIPYHHIITYKTIKTYKNDINSKIKFIIEIENKYKTDAGVGAGAGAGAATSYVKETNFIYDFYVLITSNEITNNDSKNPELSKFAKDEILSFLSRLNLYR
jgi:hypothetical protein